MKARATSGDSIQQEQGLSCTPLSGTSPSTGRKTEDMVFFLLGGAGVMGQVKHIGI